MPKVQGNGTVYQIERNKPKSKCRKWQLRVNIGRDKSNGKYPPMTKVVHGTYTEAKSLLREFIEEIERGQVPIKRKEAKIFKEYAEAWLESEKTKTAYKTWTKYETHIKDLNMHIGYAKVAEIDAEDIETAFKALSLGESPSGRPLTGTTLSNIASTAHKIFKSMVRDKIIFLNPMDYVDRPKPDTKEKRALSIERIHELVSKLDPTQPSQLAILLCIKLGIRRGEAHGLSWDDIDFEEKIVHIRHSFDDGGHLKETKSEKERNIPLTASVEEDLWKRMDHQIYLFARNRRKYGTDVFTLSSSTAIISNGFGERLLPHVTTRWLDRNRNRLGFPTWTLHEMRHSYRTQLRKLKVDRKIAQELLGHSSETISDLYDHVDIDELQDAIKVIDW